MTIPKAIKHTNEVIREHSIVMTIEQVRALHLGIEALKRLLVYRAPGQSTVYRLLPGETEE